MRPILYSSIFVSVIVGCDSPNQAPVEQSIAKAVHVEDPEKTAREALEKKERAERQERAAETKRKTDARAADIDAAAVLPETVPAKVADACDAAVDAFDQFMKNGPEKYALIYYQTRRAIMAERRAACVTQANPTVAACLSRALLAPLPTLADLDRTEAANLVFTRCADKFGKT